MMQELDRQLEVDVTGFDAPAHPSSDLGTLYTLADRFGIGLVGSLTLGFDWYDNEFERLFLLDTLTDGNSLRFPCPVEALQNALCIYE